MTKVPCLLPTTLLLRFHTKSSIRKKLYRHTDSLTDDKLFLCHCLISMTVFVLNKSLLFIGYELYIVSTAVSFPADSNRNIVPAFVSDSPLRDSQIFMSYPFLLF